MLPGFIAIGRNFFVISNLFDDLDVNSTTLVSLPFHTQILQIHLKTDKLFFQRYKNTIFIGQQLIIVLFQQKLKGLYVQCRRGQLIIGGNGIFRKSRTQPIKTIRRFQEKLKYKRRIYQYVSSNFRAGYTVLYDHYKFSGITIL